MRTTLRSSASLILLLLVFAPLTASSASACGYIPPDYMRADVIVEGWIETSRLRPDLGVRPIIALDPNIYFVPVEIPLRVVTIHRGYTPVSVAFFERARSDQAGNPEVTTRDGVMLDPNSCQVLSVPPPAGAYVLGAFRYGEGGLLR